MGHFSYNAYFYQLRSSKTPANAHEMKYVSALCIGMNWSNSYLLQERPQNLQNSVFPVGRAGIFGGSPDFGAGVGDCVAETGILKHFNIVEVISESAGFVR